MRKHKIISVLILVTGQLLTGVYGQESNRQDYVDYPKAPVSPGAASIIRSVTYPVNYGTGTANISIPLFEITEGDITLPVTLNYSTLGLKISEHGGVVGACWNLKAQASVVRNLNGNKDEYYYLNNMLDEYPYSNVEGDILNRDYEPDQFYYNLLDVNGGFFFDKIRGTKNNQVVTIPYKPVKITSSLIGTSSNPFTIIDDKGIKYEFDGKNGIEQAQSSGGAYISKWNVTNITSSSTNASLAFTYGPSTYPSLPTEELSDQIAIDYMDSRMLDKTHFFNDPMNPVDYNSLLLNPMSMVVVRHSKIDGMYAREGMDFVIDGTFRKHTIRWTSPDNGLKPSFSPLGADDNNLSSIQFASGKLTFNYDGRLLSSIVLTNNRGTVIRKVSFEYSLLTRNKTSSSDVDQHLKYKIDRIVITGKGDDTGIYTFDYHRPGNLPLRTSKEQDHWGYYNAGGNSGMAVPRCTFKLSELPGMGILDGNSTQNNMEITIGEANREPNEYFTMMGALTKITYPTGGITEFTYESNSYMNYLTNKIEKGGGLRIKRIVDYPVYGSTASPTVRDFYYSPGICNRPPSIKDYYTTSNITYVPSLASSDVLYNKRTTFSSSPLVDLSGGMGAPVVYSTINEVVNDSILTRYEYDYQYSPDRVFDIDREIGVYTSSRNEWAKGNLLKKVTTIAKNGKNKLLQEEIYDYIDLKFAYTGTNMFHRTRQIYQPIFTGSYRADANTFYQYRYASYLIQRGCKLPVSTTINTYNDDGTKFTATTRHTYNGSGLTLYPTRTEINYGDGMKEYTELKYPGDNIGLTGDYKTAADNLYSANRLNTVLRKSKWITKNGRNNLVLQLDNLYKNIDIQGKFVAALNEAKVKFMEGESATTHFKCDVYDQYGNPVQITNKEGLNVVYLWSYGGHYIVCEIVNTTINDVYQKVWGSISAGESAMKKLSEKWPADDELKNDYLSLLYTKLSNSDVHISSFFYNPLIGVTAVTDPARLKTIYRYNATTNKPEEIRIEKENGTTDLIQKFGYSVQNK